MAAYTTIDNPELYFQTVLYTGNDSNRTITLPGDEDMAPDLVWVKNREQSDWHRVASSVAGTGVQLGINANAEDTNADGFTGFVSTGFTLGADASNIGVNETGETHVAWCWTANGTGSANTAGSINTDATSANTTAGFSIMKYEGNGVAGATIGHGLGAVPGLILAKNRSTGSIDWLVFHGTQGGTKYLLLNTTGAVGTATSLWNDTNPTSTLITIGTTSKINTDGDDYIAYAWAEKQGYSKFGSYKGNGNDDGTFVWTGFKPAFLMTKTAGDAGDNNWHMMDNKRNGFNPENHLHQADLAVAEETGSSFQWIDFLSNGFKAIDSVGSTNSSGAVFLYVAFAESPFVNSNGVQNNAR